MIWVFWVGYVAVLFAAMQLGWWIARRIIARDQLREAHRRSVANLFKCKPRDNRGWGQQWER